MNVCLEILNEQVKNFKENYIGLVGAFEGILEFSGYAVESTHNTVPIYQKQIEKINKNLRNLHEQLLELRDEVSKL